jgi:CheY-like chemotaxis protein
VLDDDPDTRLAMQSILEDEGLHVEVAADCAEAVAGATRHPPSLVVLDITLPGPDGYEVARRLRARHDSELQILAVTADGSAARKARGVGAFAYLRKPSSSRRDGSYPRRPGKSGMPHGSRMSVGAINSLHPRCWRGLKKRSWTGVGSSIRRPLRRPR